MSSKSVDNLEFIETNMDAILYRKILNKILLEAATKLQLADDFIFQKTTIRRQRRR